MAPLRTITLYGIPNCDTVKKSRAWLAEAGVEVRFHDFRKDGVPQAELARWLDRLGSDALINRRGTTWRGLGADEQARANDPGGAVKLMCAHPSVIKRPVIDWGDAVTVGFEPEAWAERLRGLPGLPGLRVKPK